MPEDTGRAVSPNPDLRRLLGFETSDQIDGFLRAHDTWIHYTLDDLERERAGLQRLGFWPVWVEVLTAPSHDDPALTALDRARPGLESGSHTRVKAPAPGAARFT